MKKGDLFIYLIFDVWSYFQKVFRVYCNISKNRLILGAKKHVFCKSVSIKNPQNLTKYIRNLTMAEFLPQPVHHYYYNWTSENQSFILKPTFLSKLKSLIMWWLLLKNLLLFNCYNIIYHHLSLLLNIHQVIFISMNLDNLCTWKSTFFLSFFFCSLKKSCFSL